MLSKAPSLSASCSYGITSWRRSEIQKLELSQNRIKLENSHFNGLSNVTQLGLSSNEIVQLVPNVFKGVKNLESLALYANKIDQIPFNIFNCKLIIFISRSFFCNYLKNFLIDFSFGRIATHLFGRQHAEVN